MARSFYGQVIVVLAALLAPGLAHPSGVQALFDLHAPATSPFPSDRFTVRDETQNTRLRIDLPKPDCSIQVSDCEDIDTLNALDGFNLQPRLSIPFSGPIDVSTVSNETVLLIKLGDARRRGHHDDDDVDDDDDDDDSNPHGRSHRPDKIGINQIVWDVATNTLHVESDELLDQHTRYALIVTGGVKDTNGRSVRASDAFERFRDRSQGLKAYRKALLKGLNTARRAGIHHHDIVAASVFTTQSTTAILEKIRDQIKAAAVAPADFILGGPLGPDGKPVRSVRTVFPLSTITTMRVNEQISTAPAFALLTPNLANLRIIPGAIGTVAFGSYRSPVYLNAGRFIPPVGTRTGTPVVQGEDEVFFNLFLPAATAVRPRPAGGWPVAIYGVGGNPDTKNQQPFQIAATLANRGIATIAIEPPAQGAGPLSTFVVGLASGATVTFLAGGRSLDIDGDGTIGRGENFRALSPRQIVLGRDTRRQTIADLMQLVRVIQVGMDADGDGAADLDPSRIYFAGFSNGAFIGTAFAAVERSVRAAVLNAPGGLVGDSLRLSPLPLNRNFLGTLLASREPSLINAPGITTVDGVPLPPTSGEDVQFNENMPLRNDSELVVRLADGTSQTILSPVVNTVPGAMQIQQLLEHMEWAYMPVDPVAFAPHLQRTLVQFAKGDQSVMNPTTTAILRAGDLADWTTYYRTDRAVETYGTAPGVAKNPHPFLVMLGTPTRAAIARAAQEQIAVFFESDGTTVIDPNEVLLQLLKAANLPLPQAPLFEVPIERPLPEDLNLIP